MRCNTKLNSLLIFLVVFSSFLYSSCQNNIDELYIGKYYNNGELVLEVYEDGQGYYFGSKHNEYIGKFQWDINNSEELVTRFNSGFYQIKFQISGTFDEFNSPNNMYIQVLDKESNSFRLKEIGVKSK